jgi:hypothetical protein
MLRHTHFYMKDGSRTFAALEANDSNADATAADVHVDAENTNA